MSKKIRISLIIAIIFFILVTFTIVIFKPKYELNKAIEYLKKGNYIESYNYIESKDNDENKVIIKELISQIFYNRAGKGLKKIDDISNKCTDIVRKVDINNIDYTLDDNINVDVKALGKYMSLKEEISKDMIDSEIAESYDIYFNIIEYISENFYDVLNHIKDKEFIDKIDELSSDMLKISNDCNYYMDNHNFNPKTKKIFLKIENYIIK